MATVLPNNLVFSPAVGTPAAPGPYVGWELDTTADLSTGPRIYCLTVDPNGTLTAPKGSICLCASGDFKHNTDGAATWANVP